MKKNDVKKMIAQKMKEAETPVAKETYRNLLIDILTGQDKIVFNAMRDHPDAQKAYQIALYIPLSQDQIRRTIFRLKRLGLVDLTERTSAYAVTGNGNEPASA